MCTLIDVQYGMAAYQREQDQVYHNHYTEIICSQDKTPGHNACS